MTDCKLEVDGKLFLMKERKTLKHGKNNGVLLLWMLVLCFALTFTGCGKKNVAYLHEDTSQVDKSRSSEENCQAFEQLMEEIFIDEVTGDTLTLNYTLAEPANYGIQEEEVTLGEYSSAAMKEDALKAENWIARLKTFDYESLEPEQQLLYDIVADRLQLETEAADMVLYTEVLGPTTGIQAQLPILLSEYSFREKQDVDTYLELLGCVPEYFEQIIAFEKEKSSAGLFMSDDTAEAIISQCEEFIQQKDNNYLITVFNDNLEEFEGLTQEEMEQYQEKNQQLVTETVLPAYENLINGLKKLMGTGKNDEGLAAYKKGKDYYCYLLKATTGSKKTPEEMEELLETEIKEAQKGMAKIIDTAPEAYYAAMDADFPHTDPEESLSYLKEAIATDFPNIPDVDYSVKYVNECLEEYLSPAFYITPAIDDYDRNDIYINGASESSNLFTTLAHEGYPGHLYQNVYFQAKDVNPLRKIINITGYSEGWATYVEMYAYDLSGLEKNVSDLLKYNGQAALFVYARTDIGVNYDGWSEEETLDYLEDFGYSKEDSETIFQTMVEEPGNYMPYAIGYLEIEKLKEEAQEKLGNAFVLKDFHEFFLNQGACPFDLLEIEMWKWLDKQGKR